MRFLIVMNLSPRWCGILSAEGWDTCALVAGWQCIGAGSRGDALGLQDKRIVLTHDLDYGTMLATTNATGPSVIQVRTQDVRPQTLSLLLLPLLRLYERELDAGVLLIVDDAKSRVRLLPLAGKSGP